MENKARVQPRPVVKRRRRTPTPLGWLVFILLFAAIGLSIFFYLKYRDSQQKLNNPTVSAKAETQELINKVGKLTLLPSSEAPTIATVSDVSKLAGQSFFKNAQNGDKVLIYTKAKKAYLYRPSTDRIINIAPVNLGNTNSNSSTPTTPSGTTQDSTTNP